MSRPRRLVIEADGGSRGNPGPAGYGAIVRDAATGAIIASARASIGRATNNVAEYRGLIAGLAAAARFDAASVEVRMDSKLVVEQMSGRWKIKHPDLQPLAVRARDLAQTLPDVRYTWIPRGINVDADRLANEAMDGLPALTGDEEGAPPESVEVARSSWTPEGPKLAMVLLRHGVTAHTVERRFSGHTDLVLTAAGEAQAAAAGARLRTEGITAIVASPLRRTRQTAGIVADILDLPVSTDDDLRETDFGAWDGLSLAEVRRDHGPAYDAWTASTDASPPGGESFSVVERRVRRARLRILAQHRTGTVLVVSHVTPIKLILGAALGTPLDVLFRIHLDPAGLSRVDWHDGGAASVRLVNGTDHLASLGSTA